MTKFYALTIALIGFTAASYAQSAATATTTAILVIPISIANTEDLHFGTVAASGTAGTVAIDYADTRTAGGGASLPAGSTLQKTAVFVVTGQGTSGFSISHPASLIITETVGAVATMTVNAITNDVGASGSLVGGTKTIKVKGTLQVGVNQIAGTYENLTALVVTVNYN